MKKELFIIVLLGIFVFSGCATMDKRTDCMVKGAIVGAGIGAGAGGVIGHQGDAENDTEGAWIGAAAGAVIGGAVGFMVCKAEEEPVIKEQWPEPEPEPKPEPEPEAKPKPEPKERKVVEKIVINAIRFNFDSAQIKPAYFAVLDEAARILKKHSGRDVIIEGHTCSIGTESYNMGLGKRRAQSAKVYLTNKGIDPDRLTVKSYGEEKPVASNSTKEGREKNRRVEFRVVAD